ncbi:hypothetical protein V1289_002071 [Bradyrhizobium sp. AZCC 2289]
MGSSPLQNAGAGGTLPDRHCERSEAIHAAAERKDGLLRRFAPRNDGTPILGINPRSRRAMRSSCARNFVPPTTEGAGKAGCPEHPQPVCIGSKHTVVTTVAPENTRLSPRNGFNGFLRASPSDEFLFVTVASQIKICPSRATSCVRNQDACLIPTVLRISACRPRHRRCWRSRRCRRRATAILRSPHRRARPSRCRMGCGMPA